MSLESCKKKLALLEAKRNNFMRQGKYASMQALEEDIKAAKRLIEKEEEYRRPKPIHELMSHEKIVESGIMVAMMECNLAADYLTDCAFALKDIISKLGLQATTVMPELDEIIKKSNAFASMLLVSNNEHLKSMLIDNDTLISALHKKTMKYIEQRIPKDKVIY